MCSLFRYKNQNKGSKCTKISIREVSDNHRKKRMQISNFNPLKLIFGSGLDLKKLSINQVEDYMIKIEQFQVQFGIDV